MASKTDANAQSDPDPTSQIPWPSASRKTAGSSDRDRRGSNTGGTSGGDRLGVPKPGGERGVRFQEGQRSSSPQPAGRTRLTTWDFLFLSISMFGAQITWSVELGYGTPFLVGLGLSETATSLVWLAGPISGLVAQPLIGAISDSSASKYRRRFWISFSTGALVIALTLLAYCKSWARFLVDVFSSEPSWDSRHELLAHNTAIFLAILAMYILDFALNALQASLRNLLLDIAPPDQLSMGNAWHGRLTHAGSIIGYTIGFTPLHKLPIVRLLGGDQFRKFCIITIFILVASVWVTCWTQEEKERPRSLARQKGQLSEAINNIKIAIFKLPKPIRRVCYVQMFAFMGWFPFLFYATLYIGQVMAYELRTDPTVDQATRIGELAMTIHSIVAVTAGTILPHLAQRDKRLLAHESDHNADDEMVRLRNTVLEWKAEAARQGRPVHLPYMPFLLRNIWTGALLLFSCLMLSTFFVTTVNQAITVVALVGICWAVACWVPFAIIMEFLKEMEKPDASNRSQNPRGRSPMRRPSHSRVASTPAYLHPGFLTDGERQPLLRHRSMDDSDAIADDEASSSIAGGTVLGIHNLAIVCPQFIISIISSIIFKIADVDVRTSPDEPRPVYLGKNGVAWVLRFAGLCTLAAALIARAVPPTNTEKAMRRRLAHMRVLKEAGSP